MISWELLQYFKKMLHKNSSHSLKIPDKVSLKSTGMLSQEKLVTNYVKIRGKLLQKTSSTQFYNPKSFHPLFWGCIAKMKSIQTLIKSYLVTILWVWSNAFLLKRRAAGCEAMASAAAEFSLGSSSSINGASHKSKSRGGNSDPHLEHSSTTTLVLLFPDGLGNSLSHGNTILRLALQNSIFWCHTATQ